VKKVIFQAQMTFTEGLQLTAIAMTIVFILLFVISLILGLFKYIPQEKPKVVPQRKKPKVAVATGVNYSELESDEDMMVAALVASMEAAGENKDTNYKITRITKL
jgi:Na+-transporting methylmalonyl-CoA/oxaloacetate decarboxylase gamma subunit